MLIAVIAAASTILSFIEQFFIPSVPVPGVKPGLANLPLLLVFQHVSVFGLVVIQLLRIIAGAILFKGFNSVGVLLSLMGASGAVFALYAVKISGKMRISLAGTGALMAALHIIMQIFGARIVLGTPAVFSYLPLAGILSVLFGFSGGIFANLIDVKLRRS